MVLSCIRFFLFVQSVRATCTGNATGCRSPSSAEAINMVQRKSVYIGKNLQPKVRRDVHLTSTNSTVQVQHRASERVEQKAGDSQNQSNDGNHKAYPSWPQTVCEDAFQHIKLLEQDEKDGGKTLLSMVPGLCNPSTSTCSKIVIVGGDSDGVGNFAVFLNALRKNIPDVSEIIFLPLDHGGPAHPFGVESGGAATCPGRDVFSWFAPEDPCTTNTKNELRRGLARLASTPESVLITHSTGYTFVAQLMAEEPALFKDVQTVIHGSPLITLANPVKNLLLTKSPKWFLQILLSLKGILPIEPPDKKIPGINDPICGTCNVSKARRYLDHLMWIGDRVRLVSGANRQQWKVNATFRIFRLDKDNVNSMKSMKEVCDMKKSLCTGETVFPGKTGDNEKDRWYHNLFATTPAQADVVIHEIRVAKAIAKAFRSDGERQDWRVSSFVDLPKNQTCNPW